MIFKKITTQIKGKSKVRSVADLIDYITVPNTKNHEEKLLFSGTKGFVFEDYELQKKEILSLVQVNTRSPSPVMHYLFSWQENEQPTKEQVEELVDIFVNETGLCNNQIIWGVHQNTKNIHVHLAVNKIDIDTEKITRINNNLDIEIMHKIVAKVEHRQGWQSTPNSRYICDEHGNILRANSEKISTPIKQKVCDFEVATGEQSAIRIAKKSALQIIKNAKSWEELHNNLDKLGIKYERKGSGAIIFVGKIPVKASAVDRSFSLKNMEKRLGILEENLQTQPPLGLKQEINFLEMENIYGKISERNGNENTTEQGTIYQEQDFKRPRVLPKSSLLPLPKCPLVHRSQGKLQRKHKRRNRRRNRDRKLETLLPTLRRTFGKVNNFLRWDGARAISKTHLDLWFKYQHEKMLAYQQNVINKLKASIGADKFQKITMPKFIDWLKINNFTAELNEWRYTRQKNYLENSQTNDILEVKAHIPLEEKFKDIVQSGWKKITVSGTDFFKQLAIKLSLQYKLEITNPELQEKISEEQKTTKLSKINELNNFKNYHNAVRADKYRVTCIKIAEDNTKQAFILDKQYQINGFTPEQIQDRLQEMLKIQAKGNNIYLTPISAHKHHILVDDMDNEKLAKLLTDGYKPATIIESSPNNYQAILTISKLGSEFDKNVGNRLTEKLNKQYGDEKLSGCIHPHRVPGFENQKPKHKRADGTYPKVKLIKAEQIECDKAYKLSLQINEEHKTAKIKKLEKQNNYLNQAAITSPHKAYFLHLDNIKQHLDIMDKSRVDSMIALRMRATGHSQNSIEQTIRECAKQWRDETERKNWDNYAKRTAEYAFSFAGDRDLDRNQRYVEHWLRIEHDKLQERKYRKVK